MGFWHIYMGLYGGGDDGLPDGPGIETAASLGLPRRIADLEKPRVAAELQLPRTIADLDT